VGTKIEAGIDVNSNNILDPGEVDPALTSYLCNGADGNAFAVWVQSDGTYQSIYATRYE
jgi:hypothetical protein